MNASGKVFFKIVIANYNNMAYIKQCLDSILQQSFQDFKIVIVDDLSTDLSYEFAKAYERKHPDKLTVLRAPEKKLAGGCRNIGIDYDLPCEYLYFVDPDDYLYDQNSLQKMHDHAVRLKMPDIMLVGYCKQRNNVFQKIRFPKYETMMDKMANSKWMAGWTKICRSTICEHFLEDCMHGEDTYQFLKMLDKNPSIKQIDDCIYVYRIQPNSVIRTSVRSGKGIYIQTKNLFYQKLAELLKTVKTDAVKKSIRYRLCHRL